MFRQTAVADGVCAVSITLVTTFRARDAQRVRNLETILRWYEQMPHWELLVIEQDREPHLDSSAWSASARHVFLPNSGPFNKGWGMNTGARLAANDVLLFCDADLLLPLTALQTGENLARRRVAAVNPYDRLIELDEDETEALLRADPTQIAPDFDAPRARSERGNREQLPFCGGAFFMRRSMHRQLGGFDERYLGWGGEDDALSTKLLRSTSSVASLESRSAIHLWHARDYEHTFGDPHYPANRARLKRLRRADKESLIFLCDVQRQIMGNPDKYTATVTGPQPADQAPGDADAP